MCQGLFCKNCVLSAAAHRGDKPLRRAQALQAGASCGTVQHMRYTLPFLQNTPLALLLATVVLAFGLPGQPLLAQQRTAAELDRALDLARQLLELDPPREAMLESGHPMAGQPAFRRTLDAMNFERINAQAIAAMVELFSIAEMEALIAFRRSPAGQSATEKMPLYQRYVGSLVQNHFTETFRTRVAPALTPQERQSLQTLGQGGAATGPPVQVQEVPLGTPVGTPSGVRR